MNIYTERKYNPVVITLETEREATHLLTGLKRALDCSTDAITQAQRDTLANLVLNLHRFVGDDHVR